MDHDETFLSIPFLPDTDVKLMLVDGRINEMMEESLKRVGIRLIKTGSCPDLMYPISFHPDMMIHPVGANVMVTAPNAYFGTITALKQEGFEIITGSSTLNSNYPYDISYNIARIGNKVLHNFKYTDAKVRQILQAQGLCMINVKQGYTKCSIAVIDQNSIITEDIGIARTAANAGIDVLLVHKGYIQLPGMNYGFIGGCCGLISRHVIAFAGDVSKHPDYLNIKQFLHTRKIEIYNLACGKLQDLGSLIPLKQKKWHKAAV